jgi:bacterioferritin
MMAKEKKDKVLDRLTTAFAKELETVINYLVNATMMDGVRAEEIKTNLAADVQEELLHATQLAKRIKQLGGMVPGSLDLDFGQKCLQPPKDTTDVVGVIKGVIDAEEDAIANYKALVKECNETDDYVTQDLCIRLLTDEEGHLTQFRGYLKEYEKK